jgi:peptidoglycan/LPS O-acetylase OafA/YrhL
MNEFQIKNTNIIQFDSIRCVFALFVIIVHHQFMYANVPAAFAYLAMHTFFIMSAFLISRGLIISKPKANNFWDFYKQFYIKRILRIFPVYFVYLFFIIGLGVFFYVIGFGDILKVLSELKKFGWMLFTFTYNFRELSLFLSDKSLPDFIFFSHLWSLSMEEQFYFIIPFFIYFLNRKQLVMLSILVIVCLPIFRIWYYENILVHEKDYILKGLIYYRATYLQSDCFFYGILLATFNFKKYVNLYKYILYVIFIVYIILIVYNGMIVSQESNNSFLASIFRYDFMILNQQHLYHDVLINWFIFFLFLYSFYNPNFLSFFNNKFVLHFGNRLTYSSYVYQYIVILPMVGLINPFLIKILPLPLFLIQFLCLCISIFLIYILSNLSYRKMEIKFLHLYKNTK